MKDETINKLLYELDDVIPPKRIGEFKAELAPLGEQAYITIMAVPTRNAFTTLLLAIFLGFLGINRFYIKQYLLGVAKIALTAFTTILFASSSLEFPIKYGILLLYAIIYCFDAAFSFTSCRYANLKAIRKAIYN